VVGVDKAKLKTEIRELKLEQAAALEAGDHERLKRARRKIHRLKGKLRRATI
jgi:hypothetical protein